MKYSRLAPDAGRLGKAEREEQAELVRITAKYLSNLAEYFVVDEVLPEKATSFRLPPEPKDINRHPKTRFTLFAKYMSWRGHVKPKELWPENEAEVPEEHHPNNEQAVEGGPWPEATPETIHTILANSMVSLTCISNVNNFLRSSLSLR